MVTAVGIERVSGAPGPLRRRPRGTGDMASGRWHVKRAGSDFDGRRAAGPYDEARRPPLSGRLSHHLQGVHGLAVDADLEVEMGSGRATG